MSGLPLRDNLVGNPSAGQYKTALGLFFDYVSGLHFWGPGKIVSAKDVAFLPGVYGYKFLVCTKAGTTGTDLPAITDVGTTVTDGTAEWSVRDLSNPATADHAELADEATNALALEGHEVGVGIGNIPVLIDKGDGVSALPQVDGSQLTGISAGLVAATTAQAQAGTDNTVGITPARLREAFNASGSAPVFACRAWVNFIGTGTVAIRRSGNVSSITDNGTGNYTVNFTTPMPDSDYSFAVGLCNDDSYGPIAYIQSAGSMTASSLRFQIVNPANGSVAVDRSLITVAVFR